MTAVCVLFWIPLFMQTTWNFTPMESAVHMVPQAVAGLLLSPSIGLFIDGVKETHILAVSALFQLGACVPLLFLQGQSSYWAFIVPTLVLSTVATDWSCNVTTVSTLTSP
jgi:hypothetical protein